MSHQFQQRGSIAVKNTLRETFLYICEFISNGQRRSLLLRPIDAANGVILDGDEDGNMTGTTYGGQQVKLSIGQILKIERYKVGFNDMGSGHKSRDMSEKQVERAIENRTNKKTGEVTGITSFEDKKKSDNRYSRD